MKHHKIVMDALINLDEEKGKLEKNRTPRKRKQTVFRYVENYDFVNKVPETKVKTEKEKAASYIEKLKMTKTQFDNILKKLG